MFNNNLSTIADFATIDKNPIGLACYNSRS
jgi:hypothetical protein